MNYDPTTVARLVATLLSHSDNIEPHHVRKAVATARMILDEINAANAEAVVSGSEV
jgi:hypothetical protein